MKRLTIVSAAVLAAIVSLPSMARDNDTLVGDYYVGPRIGLFGTDSDRLAVDNGRIDTFAGGFDSAFAGIEAGMNFTPEWGYRMYFDYLRGDAQSLGTVDGTIFGVDVMYNFDQNWYGTIGFNATDYADQVHRFYRVGLGHKTFLNNDWALTVEGAVQQDEGDQTEFLVMTGLRYYFGMNGYNPNATAAAEEPAAAPAPVVRDSDRDGVADDRDACADTPAGYKVDANGCTVYENETVRRDLVVTFGFDSSVIPADQKGDIRVAADFLKEYPQLDVTIEGHTDSTGPADYNQWLSEQRAKAVGDSLVSDFGIEQSRVNTVGYGETKPRVSNDTRENRALNRRIEANMSVTKQVPVKD